MTETIIVPDIELIEHLDFDYEIPCESHNGHGDYNCPNNASADWIVTRICCLNMRNKHSFLCETCFNRKAEGTTLCWLCNTRYAPGYKAWSSTRRIKWQR